MDSIRVKKGQVFHIPVGAVNRDPTVWGVDAENFDPDRWLDPSRIPSSNMTTAGVSGLLSFFEGPRMCIGYRLALFEFKVILSALIREFKFMETGDSIEVRASPTLQPYIAGRKEAGIQLPLLITPIER